VGFWFVETRADIQTCFQPWMVIAETYDMDSECIGNLGFILSSETVFYYGFVIVCVMMTNDFYLCWSLIHRSMY